jgi:hypothetical protein
VETAAKTYAAVQEAMKTLEDKPGDPEANLILGKYLCLTKGDWAKGLPMLAKSDDAKWQPLAKKDMDGADTAKDMARLGDAWWGASKGRAVYWYKQALPGTSGAEKDRIKKRIALAGSSSSPSARLIPTITDSRTETWSGSTTNAARYSRLTFAVANGKGDVGYGGAGMEIQDVPELTVAVEASPAFRYYDVNSFAGFMVDYHTKSGYTKRLALGIGMHDKGRWESQPSWGGPRETAGSCRSGNPRDL